MTGIDAAGHDAAMKTNPETAIEMARLSGVAIDMETALRVLRFVGPAIETFAPMAVTLPLDCEPAGFIVAQKFAGDA